MGLGSHPEIDHPNFIRIMSHQVNANLINSKPKGGVTSLVEMDVIGRP